MDSLYQAELLALARSLKTLTDIPNPTQTVSLNNPVCGDRVIISVKSTAGRIDTHHIKAEGCALCAAGAGLWHQLTHLDDAQSLRDTNEQVKNYLTGKTAQASLNHADGLAAFAPVIAYKNRHKCVLLSFQAAAKLADLL